MQEKGCLPAAPLLPVCLPADPMSTAAGRCKGNMPRNFPVEPLRSADGCSASDSVFTSQHVGAGLVPAGPAPSPSTAAGRQHLTLHSTRTRLNGDWVDQSMGGMHSNWRHKKAAHQFWAPVLEPTRTELALVGPKSFLTSLSASEGPCAESEASCGLQTSAASRAAMTRAASIKDLPDEVLEAVFDHLELQERCAAVPRLLPRGTAGPAQPSQGAEDTLHEEEGVTTARAKGALAPPPPPPRRRLLLPAGSAPSLSCARIGGRWCTALTFSSP